MSCDSNERHTPDVANPAEDLFRHSAKKREDETNISPKNSLTLPAADIHASASHRSGSYPAPGIQGGGVSPLVIKNQSAFSTQPFNFFDRRMTLGSKGVKLTVCD